MHYLITQHESGHRLVDFSEDPRDLLPQILSLTNDNADSLPVVLNDAVLKSAYMVDAFGIIIQEADGFLVPVAELIS